MNRKQFMQVAATSILAVGAEGVRAKVFDSDADKAAQSSDKGIAVRFLGTGAADWNGKDERGEHRRWSSILVDGHILIDFTPTNLEMLPDGCHPDTVFYTHSHGDHCHPATAIKAGVKRVYLSQTWYDIAKADFQRAAKAVQVAMPEIIPLYVGQAVRIGDLTITPLPASHATGYTFEQTLIYLLEKDGARLIYATDTGGIPAVAARLAGIDVHDSAGKPITALIMEATMGMAHDDDFRIFTHTSVGGVERIVRVLQKTNRYTPPAGQPVYLTHMARTMHPTQKELDATLPAPLAAAYDGLEVVFKA
jgi:phosphoribosyl 1,2-cyclic phosphodiesterase